MTKKPVQKPQTQNARNIFNAPIKVKGNFQAGDQYNYNLAPPENRQEFILQLQQVQAALAEVQKHPELPAPKRQEVAYVQEEVAKAIEEAGRPSPVALRIKSAVDNVKTVMDSLDSGLRSALNLGATISLVGSLALAVGKLFGM